MMAQHPTVPSLLVEASGETATLILNRPERLNSLDLETTLRLSEAVEEVHQREDIRVVVLKGAGGSLCCGSDIDYLWNLHTRQDLRTLRRYLDANKNLLLKVLRLRHFVVAAVDGSAAGIGCNLSLAADWCLATERSAFGYPAKRLGVAPDLGATWFLANRLGRGHTLELIFSGDMLPPEKAQRNNLINSVVANNALAGAILKVRARALAASPLVWQSLKRSLYESAVESLDKILEKEIDGYLRFFLSRDCREGFEAFLEDREPDFRGL